MPIANNNVDTKKYLLPLSWIYGLIVYIRNKLFDLKILKQKSYDIPVICIGNITVGGTGKTPHTEYLIKLLSKNFRVAVLSRGYKRKTSGYVLSDENSTAKQIGDEPYQMKNKFCNISVAVDGKRTRGIEKLLSLPRDEKPQVILLDDAYQHRYVKPSYSILLTDYNRLITEDKLIPVGRLREPAHYSEQANSIIVTKCPQDINPLDQRIILKDMNVYPYQDLLYTTFRYGNLENVFDKQKTISLETNKHSILAVTGIANPSNLYEYLKNYSSDLLSIEYPDHYQFKMKDITDIQHKFNEIASTSKIIVITEKDAARLRCMKYIPDELKQSIYYIPIEVTFINKEEKDRFDQKIIEHVEQYKANS